MAPQAWILLCCTLVSVFLESRAGLEFEMVRNPGSFYCARLRCVNDVNTDVSTFSTKSLIIYDINDKGARTKLAYIDRDKPNMAIDKKRMNVVNGTGHITEDHADVTLDFHSDADCLRGTYICELQYLGLKGTTEVESETIIPGEQSGECSCSTIMEQFSSMTTRANGIDSQIFTQRQVNGDLNSEVRDLKQDLNEKQNALEKLTQASALMREAINSQIQNDKDIEEEIAAEQRSDELLTADINDLRVSGGKQEQALAEQRAQDEANKVAIAELRQVDVTVVAEINVRKRFDAVFADAIQQLQRKDDSFGNQIDDIGRIHRSLLEQITSLRQSDDNQASQIKALQSTNDAQAQSINQLTSNFETQVNQISQLREADASFKATIEQISQNNTAFDATILGLRRNSQQYLQDAAAQRHKDQVTENQISLLTANYDRHDQEILALQQEDTRIWKRIEDYSAADNDITGQISSLQSKNVAFSVQIIALGKADAVLQAQISNQSAVYESLQQQILVVSQKNVQLLQQLSELNEKILLFKHYVAATHVTTVVKTTTKLSNVQCTRGMAHTASYETIMVDGVATQCDTETDNGGWVVVERRGSADVDFDRSWEDYKKGFGSVDSSYFIGLEPLHKLNTMGYKELRVDLKADGKSHYAHYDSFSVGGEDSYYKLNVKGYSGDAGDSLSESDGAGFSTRDGDHDNDTTKNCAQECHGGWWYKDCRANVDGVYGQGAPYGMVWPAFSESKPITYLEIKVRNVESEQGYN